MTDLRTHARELAKRSIVTEATARLVEQVLTEAHDYYTGNTVHLTEFYVGGVRYDAGEYIIKRIGPSKSESTF